MLVEHLVSGKSGDVQELRERHLLHRVLRSQQTGLVGVVDFWMRLLGGCRWSHVEAFCEFDIWAPGGIELDHGLAARKHPCDLKVHRGPINIRDGTTGAWLEGKAETHRQRENAF